MNKLILSALTISILGGILYIIHVLKNINTYKDGYLEVYYSPELDEIHLYDITKSKLYLSTGGSISISRKSVIKNCKYLGAF